MLRRLIAKLTKRRNRTDPALVLPPDPRDPHHDPRQGWACPAVVKGHACGLPKTPTEETCKRPSCRAWASRKRRGEQAVEQAEVFAFNGRRGAA